MPVTLSAHTIPLTGAAGPGLVSLRAQSGVAGLLLSIILLGLTGLLLSSSPAAG